MVLRTLIGKLRLRTSDAHALSASAPGGSVGVLNRCILVDLGGTDGDGRARDVRMNQLVAKVHYDVVAWRGESINLASFATLLVVGSPEGTRPPAEAGTAGGDGDRVAVGRFTSS